MVGDHCQSADISIVCARVAPSGGTEILWTINWNLDDGGSAGMQMILSLLMFSFTCRVCRDRYSQICVFVCAGMCVCVCVDVNIASTPRRADTAREVWG